MRVSCKADVELDGAAGAGSGFDGDPPGRQAARQPHRHRARAIGGEDCGGTRGGIDVGVRSVGPADHADDGARVAGRLAHPRRDVGTGQRGRSGGEARDAVRLDRDRGFGGDADDPETFYAFSSFATPTTVYRYDVRTGQSSVWAAPKVAFNPADYDVRQVFYASKDGTKVPMFIIHKKGVKGPAPTILYGYGGFNVSLTPSFSPTRLAWMEQGGVIAQPNLRGGGEYGKAWHDGGRLASKQNVFDDMIAAAEYLDKAGISSPRKTVIQGGSNGGLLVGAVVNQRPDLFAAALPAVGVMDMLRFDRFTAGRYWVDDYGYPSKEADFRTIYKYSPYHNIQSGKTYPAILATTADTDDRVVPGHSFKYAAALQAANPNGAPHLIRVETRAGHGAGKPTDKIIEEAADLWAFSAKWTGMDVKPVR